MVKISKNFKGALILLALLYVGIIVIFSAPELGGDEKRYWRYAENLTSGFFVDPEAPEIHTGPGYPIFLMPFAAANANPLIPKFFNALFVLIGVYFFRKTAELFMPRNLAWIAAILLGLYPPLLRFLPLLYTECLAFMLVCLLFYSISRLYLKNQGIKTVVTAALIFAAIITVKMIFLQVLFGALVLIVLAAFFRKFRGRARVLSKVLIGAFVFSIPYLLLAYSWTGKWFYFGTNGGEILYHRSTPYSGEWGNWFAANHVINGGEELEVGAVRYYNLDALSENHGEFYCSLEERDPIARDSILKSQALQNMREHPGKYAKNTVANLGRLLFHFPFSYRTESLGPYGYLLPNMFLIVLWIISFIPVYLSKKRLPAIIWDYLLITLIYGGLIVLLGGRGRNFIIMVPGLLLFTLTAFSSLLSITIINPGKSS